MSVCSICGEAWRRSSERKLAGTMQIPAEAPHANGVARAGRLLTKHMKFRHLEAAMQIDAQRPEATAVRAAPYERIRHAPACKETAQLQNNFIYRSQIAPLRASSWLCR